ncbi:BolA family transcriptional regulator [Amylibacter marinus]|uniref:BolA family transcriptional regulator n=1 Tax=Amylibacter marinus TaxID=1475483 RepID=A0ABQ5VS10_9RHOB|nr:BolA/IbaG family iron-sulfur metabolism protein [Amylibacter marinus]GLQ34076.1 BolA family transcriptional regulator [Amylibacter marinus]
MAMSASEIEVLLRATFPTADISVSGNDGVHMAADIAAVEFAGKNRVAQQRMVYAALKGAMDGSNGQLHALQLTTRVKE